MFILTRSCLLTAFGVGLGCSLFAPPAACGQSSLTLSALRIHSRIEAQNNWSPPTAISRQDRFEGTATGYGASLSYSFRPAFLIKNPRISLNAGAGYFTQRFDMRRPFDYISPMQPIFYTDHYTYHCWHWSAGLTYKQPLNENYFLSGNLSYTWLRSFRQEYTPTNGHASQDNRRPIDFGNLLVLALGINRKLGNRFSAGLDVLLPLYVRWRNDRIFKDDPARFSRPSFSPGLGIHVSYRLKKASTLKP